MYLYLVEQTVNQNYDTYDSFVVAAQNEEVAKNTHPSGRAGDWEEPYSSWCNSPDEVAVTLLGEAVEGTEYGVILASYNAG